MSRNIKILDCTLRDGGYINDWRFSDNCILNSIEKLYNSNIDIIEVGFLDDTKSDYSNNYTIFKNIESAELYVKNIDIGSRCVLMIMHGKYDVSSLPMQSEMKIRGIRYCFKKEYVDEAISNCKILIEKGYDVYLQPAALTDYSDFEILSLIEKANSIKIVSFYIVDTFGLMRRNDVLKYFYLINTNLKQEIPIGFHSHNNLQLSFSNSQALIDLAEKREIYIDSSVLGMGRGAGNLCTELIAQYINENIDSKYDLVPVLEVMDEYITQEYSKHPWGYSAPYYIAAINKCHPNYATYLMNMQTLCVQDINNIIKSIPEKQKSVYDKQLISNLYEEYQQNYIDDSTTLSMLNKLCNKRKVLVLAPGKSVSLLKKDIDSYIAANDPIVISVNHIPSDYKFDKIFISNFKRFNGIKEAILKIKDKVIFTSNITTDESLSVVNYSTYLNNDDLIRDNSGLILINILRKINVSSIALAGFDGFSQSDSKNYYDDRLINSVQYEQQCRTNLVIREYFNRIRNTIDLEFVTPTIYDGGKSNEKL